MSTRDHHSATPPAADVFSMIYTAAADVAAAMERVAETRRAAAETLRTLAAQHTDSRSDHFLELAAQFEQTAERAAHFAAAERGNELHASPRRRPVDRGHDSRTSSVPC